MLYIGMERGKKQFFIHVGQFYEWILVFCELYQGIFYINFSFNKN